MIFSVSWIVFCHLIPDVSSLKNGLDGDSFYQMKLRPLDSKDLQFLIQMFPFFSFFSNPTFFLNHSPNQMLNCDFFDFCFCAFPFFSFLSFHVSWRTIKEMNFLL